MKARNVLPPSFDEYRRKKRAIIVKTQGNVPYFEEEILCELWIEELKLCKKMKKFELYAFCLLKNHFHMVLRCSEEVNISQVMKSLKENFSRDANKIIEANDDVSEGDTSTCRLQIREGIARKKEKFLQKYGPHHNIPKFKWQQSFRDHVIRGEQDFQNHLRYTAYNFLKHKYPENWKWTSIHFPKMFSRAPSTSLFSDVVLSPCALLAPFFLVMAFLY